MRRCVLRPACVLLTVMIILCFAACSTSKNSSGQDGNTSKQADSVSTSGLKMEGKLNALMYLPEAPDLIEEILNDFQKDYPGVKINLQMDTGSNEVQIKYAANDLPDFFSGNPTSFEFSLADKGDIADISDTAAWNDMYPSLQQMWTSPKGIRFGISAGIATQFIFYNVELFKQAGINEMPKDWDEFLAVCDKLKNNGITPLAWFGGDTNMLTIGPMSMGIGNKVLIKDPDLIDKLANTKYEYGTPEWIAVFDQMKEVVDKGYVNDGYMSTDYAGGMKLFTDGKVAMIMQGSWVSNQLLNEVPFEANVFLPPWNDKGNTLVPQLATETGYCVANNENTALSKFLLDYVAYEKYYMYQNYFQSIPPFKNPKGEMQVSEKVTDITDHLSDYKVTIPFSVNIIPDSVHAVISTFCQEIYVNKSKPSDIGKVLDGVQAQYIDSK